MRCEEARDLLVQRSLGELEPDREGDLLAHLSGCPSCQSFDTAQEQISALLGPLRSPAPLPSQRQAVLARIPALRRQALTNRITRGAAVLIAASLMGLAILGVWRTFQSRMEPTARVVTESTALPPDFLELQRPNAGWVASAGLPDPRGKAIVYLYLEPAFGDHLHASVLLSRPDGRLTREIDFGPVSFGRAPFTQAEFQMLSAGSETLLAILTDDEKAGGRGRLWVIAYDAQAGRLNLVPFDREGDSLAVTERPLAVSGGIQTVNGSRAVTWALDETGRFSRRFGGDAGTEPPAGNLLAEAEISTPQGEATVRLHGSLIGDASVYLVRPDGQITEEIELGRPHFGALEITQPALRKIRLGETEVLLLLSDPLISQPEQAVLRAMAYDPIRGKLRLIPFTSGEVLVQEPPGAANGMLTTLHWEDRPGGLTQVEYHWRLTENWLFERAGERVLRLP